MLVSTYLPVIVGVALIILSSCRKDDKENNKHIPILTTTAISNITQTTATGGGIITSDGGSMVTTCGICWSKVPGPTIADSKTTDVPDTVSFISAITGLTANTKYYVRAYASNANGTGYGSAASFTTHQVGTINITAIDIPASTFTMGSSATEAFRNDNETQHQVTLNAFRMSKYEITNAQYADFLNAENIDSTGLFASGAYPSHFLIYATSSSFNLGLHYTNKRWAPTIGYENHPVIFVSWYGAAEFATYAGGRLPTEAEWECACRASSTTAFNTGACLSDEQSNYNWKYPYSNCTNTNKNYPGATQAVGSYLANAFGLYDMHGNVWEYCSDWYSDYITTPQSNPTGSATGSSKVIRGGSWDNEAQFCRSAIRGDIDPSGANRIVGFRIVLIH